MNAKVSFTFISPIAHSHRFNESIALALTLDFPTLSYPASGLLSERRVEGSFIIFLSLEI